MPRLRIRGQNWKLKLEPPDSFTDGKRDVGLCDYENKTIYVDPKDSEFIGTVLHETVHCCLPDLSEVAVKEIEEALIAALETALEALAKQSRQKDA